jgi:hypothetical protein
MSFRKIDMDLSDLNLKQFNTGICLHNPFNSYLSYYKLSFTHENILKSRLPDEFKNKRVRIFYCIMTGPGKLHPHIDKQTITAINYYIEPGNGITTFYKIIADNYQHPTIASSFKEECLEETGRFVANKNECYALDVSKIHNVELHGTERHFINYSFVESL